MLYQWQLSAERPDIIIKRFWESHEGDSDVRQFSNELVTGVAARVAEIDALLSDHSTNWKLTRMAAVDKNILRIAAFEIMNCSDIPAKVTINEAVEIAKKFGAADSAAFVNGILDNLSRKHEEENRSW